MLRLQIPQEEETPSRPNVHFKIKTKKSTVSDIFSQLTPQLQKSKHPNSSSITGRPSSMVFDFAPQAIEDDPSQPQIRYQGNKAVSEDVSSSPFS